jgi:hypothetical protein
VGSFEHSQTAVSPDLAAAQEKLLRLRQALTAKQSQSFALVSSDLDQTPSKKTPLFNAVAQTCAELGRSRRREKNSLAECVDQLPRHLGWESSAVTAVLRQPEEEKRDACDVGRNVHQRDMCQTNVPHPASRITPAKARTSFIKVYPSVAQGILREGHAAAGRVWLLLRYLDENGRGWFTESEAQTHFTSKHTLRFTHHASQSNLQSPLINPHYLFGKRQWRNIIKKGTGIFWRRENGRLWLNSVAKTAAALGVWQLNGRPVKLPVSVLTGKISMVRAHLYATFHSSRTDEAKPKPIARDSLTAQFNISPRTQRSYERKARVKSRQNFAIGKKESSENTENTAWQHGNAAFSFTDYLGKNGRSGTTYLAWQLPNHYFGPHQQACRGQQKRINRELADLFMKGMTGNDNESVEENKNLNAKGQRTQRNKEKISALSAPMRLKNTQKRFCDNGAAAAKVYNHSQAQQDVYWRSANQGVWHVLEKSMKIRD